MSVRNLGAIFTPTSVALIGASRTPTAVGGVVARNLIEGGLKASVMLVNPNASELLGHPVFPTVAALPQAPELAVIATPAHAVPGLIRELGARAT